MKQTSLFPASDDNAGGHPNATDALSTVEVEELPHDEIKDDTEGVSTFVPSGLVDPTRLHRIHASPASGKGGASFDLGHSRWRGDGGEHAWKRAAAHRLALCWNLCEGWPTDALEAGVLRDYDAASSRLLYALSTLLQEDAGALPPHLSELVEAATAALTRRDAEYDFTHGRPHDCLACLDRPRERSE